MSTDKLIAEWRTSGKDWLRLFEAQSPTLGVNYHYQGNGCGGGVPLTIKTPDAAIAKTTAAYQACKALGMTWEHGL